MKLCHHCYPDCYLYLLQSGLQEVKKKTISVYKKVLRDPMRPKDLKHQTTMNFLFIGNPGCGKVCIILYTPFEYRFNPAQLSLLYIDYCGRAAGLIYGRIRISEEPHTLPDECRRHFESEGPSG